MIEVKFYYMRHNGDIFQGYKYFSTAEKAVRFMYKCKRSKTLIYSGEFTCNDPYDVEYINRRFK